MRYGSVCSGIEAATVAWHPLGWEPAWFSEIDPFCNALLRHHYPKVHNYGDFTNIGSDAGPIDLLCGGTPCQDFSVAGLRAGLDGARGNLTLEFVKLAGRLRPRWLVWENVPGVLSIDGGRAFGAFGGGLAELGYGFAYRILDAQHFGVPQRRRRVFLVGYLGDWRPAAAVLLERESLCRDTPARRKARQEVAALTADGVGTCGADDNQAQAGQLIPFGGNNTSGSIDVATACNAHGGSMRMDFETETFCVEVAHTLRGEGMDASEDGSGRGVPIVPVGFSCKDAGADAMEVRRLTARECERLQGLPDDYTLLPNYRRRLRADEIAEMAAYLGIPLEEARNVGVTPDGPRYKAIGNSMAVPVMRWIGARIQAIEATEKATEPGADLKERRYEPVE